MLCWEDLGQKNSLSTVIKSVLWPHKAAFNDCVTSGKLLKYSILKKLKLTSKKQTGAYGAA